MNEPHKLGIFERLTQHWFFAGFLQTEGTFTNGIVSLCEILHDELNCRTNRIFSRTYRDSAKSAAARAEQVRQAKGVDERQLTTNVVSYSYGCDKAVQFCHELEQVGLHADTVILCDPVKRFSPYAMLWRPLRVFVDSIGLAPHLELPASVGRVIVFAQDVSRPWPCQVFHGGKQVEIEYLPYPHTAMDNSPEFRRAVLDLTTWERMSSDEDLY